MSDFLDNWTKEEKEKLIKFFEDCTKDLKENPYWSNENKNKKKGVDVKNE